MSKTTKTTKTTKAEEATTTVELKTKSDSEIVTNHMLFAVGMGAIPLPVVDMVGLTAIHIRMIKKLAQNHGDTFNRELATNSIAALVSAVGAQSMATGTLGSMIKAVPVIGGVVGLLTFPAIAGAMTYALGQVFIRHYENGGSLVSLDTDSAKEYFQEQFEKGKEQVKKAKNKVTGK